MRQSKTSALSRVASIVIVVVIVVATVAAAGIYFANSPGKSPSTSSVIQTSTSSSAGTTSVSQASSSSSSSSSSTVSTSSSTSSTSSNSQSSSSASSSTASSSSSQTIRDTLSIDTSAWPAPADLNELYGSTSFWPNWLMYTVYQPLIFVNPVDLFGNNTIQYMPGLAQNWTVSSNGTIVTLNLRNHVNFSSGDPFNAYQVWLEEYGFYYLSANSSYWWENYYFFNMSNVNFGPAALALINQSGLANPSQQALAVMGNSSWPIYATGPYQIEFRLKSPFNWFTGTLIAWNGLMYDSQWLLKHGGFGTPTAFNTFFNQNPIPGTGPYLVSQVSELNYVKFTQNTNYWGENLSSTVISSQPYLDPGHVKNVIVYYKSDDVARYTDLSTGAVQISEIQISDWGLVSTNPVYQYLSSPSWSGQVFLMAMNTKVYPTNNTALRQAIVHSINFTDLAQKAFLGHIDQYVGPEYPAWKDFYDLGGMAPYSYNITLAKQYLTQANITNLPALTLTTTSGCATCTAEAEVVQSDLAQIGITVNINVMQYTQYVSVYGSYSTNLAGASQIGQLSFVDAGESWAPYALTPADYWLTFVSNGSLYGNWAIYSNPVVQKCVDSFTSSTNTSYIQSLCTKAQAQIYSDAPYYWVGVDGLWLPTGGSVVWNKNVIKSFSVDPTFTGASWVPFFNTVTFVQ